MDIVKICGAALIAAVGAIVMKQLGSPLRAAVVICGTVSVLLVCLPSVTQIVNAAIDIERDAPVSEVFPVVLKVTAVALICEVCALLCEGAGEPTLSKAISLAGKFEIILIALPLFSRLYRSAAELCSAS